MKNKEKLTEADLLPHDDAEDLAYAQKPFIDIAYIAIQEMRKLESDFQPIQESPIEYKKDLYSNDIPEKLKQTTVLTTTQAALYLGVSRPHLIKYYLATGKLPYFKVGRDRRIQFSDLEKFKTELYAGNV